MIRPAHHISDAHFDIIHDRSQGVQYLTITTDQNGITDACGINRHFTQNTVYPFNPLKIQLEPPVTLAALGAQLLFFGLCQRKRRTVINRRLTHIELLFTLEIKLGRGLETLVKPTHRAQLVRRIAIAVQP